MARPARSGSDNAGVSAPVASSPRLEWSDVPARVRSAVEARLGSPVVEARTQLGGFSPGTAVRVVCADGHRAFVKAVGSELNPDTPDLNRREIRALGLLPADVPHARLLASYDDGDWVALVLEDVDGRRPGLPWTTSDVAAMERVLTQLARTTAPAKLPAFAVGAAALSAWDDVAADPAGLDPALVRRLPEMLEHQARAHEVTAGNALVHWDARNDNVIIRDGAAVLLDWAWACRGAPWLDGLLLGVDFLIQGGPDPDDHIAAAETTRDVPPADLQSMVACMVGIWSERSRRPAPPGLPTIRGWQAHCAQATLRWLDTSRLWS